MLLLNISRKPYMQSSVEWSHLTLSDIERSKSRLLRFSVVGDLYIAHMPTSSSLIFIKALHKVISWRVGFAVVSAVFLVF